MFRVDEVYDETLKWANTTFTTESEREKALANVIPYIGFNQMCVSRLSSIMESNKYSIATQYLAKALISKLDYVIDKRTLLFNVQGCHRVCRSLRVIPKTRGVYLEPIGPFPTNWSKRVKFGFVIKDKRGSSSFDGHSIRMG